MIRRYLPIALTLYIAFVFIQSLFFKFSNSPETQYIFGTLEAWGASLGFAGLFAPSGIFSQYVVGTGELIASALLLAGLSLRLRVLRPVGGNFGGDCLSPFHTAGRFGAQHRWHPRWRRIVRAGLRRVGGGGAAIVAEPGHHCPDGTAPARARLRCWPTC